MQIVARKASSILQTNFPLSDMPELMAIKSLWLFLKISIPILRVLI